MEVDLEALKSFASPQSWQRGEDYFRKGLVRVVERNSVQFFAEVSGSKRYQVRLVADGTQALTYYCTCPVNADGECCKHIVAAALAANDKEQSSIQNGVNPLKDFLHAQPVSWLAEVLCQLAEMYPDIAKQLLVQQQLASNLDANAIKKTISGMIGRPRFMDYRQSREFSCKVRDLCTTLQQILVSGKSGLCVSLCEYALERLIKIYEQGDDSGGYLGGEIAVLGDIYLKASLAATEQEKTKPSQFLKLLLVDSWGFVPDEDWGRVLGEQGAADLVRKIEAEWAKLKPNNTIGHYDTHTYKITHLMKMLAEERGDFDLLVRIYSQDLHLPYAYTKIIDLCLKYSRQREALQWAERAVKAHPRSNDLRTQLAQMYERDGLQNESLELIWQNFLNSPSEDTYLTLKHHAGLEWSTWRSKALEKMVGAEQAMFARYQKHGSVNAGRPNASLRATCLLAEDAIDEVRELLHGHQVQSGILYQLALKLHTTHNQEAVNHMKEVIAETMCQSNNQAYDQAFKFLKIMQPWMEAGYFTQYLSELRSRYKAKRNFIALIQAFV